MILHWIKGVINYTFVPVKKGDYMKFCVMVGGSKGCESEFNVENHEEEAK